MRFTEFASKDSCPVCGQTPCNCTHVAEAVTFFRTNVPNYPRDPKTIQHRIATAKEILSDPKSDPESRREAAAIIAQAEKQGAADDESLDEDLRKWFKEKWVRFGPDGKIRGDCARGDDSEGKPKCLPQAKAHALGKKGRASAAARKRREDPNPERRGPAKNVATKKKSNEGVAEGSDDYVKRGKELDASVKNIQTNLDRRIKKTDQGVAKGVTSPEIKQAYKDAMNTPPGTPERKSAVRKYQKLRADALDKKRKEQGVAEGSEQPVSFKEMVDIVDHHYPKFYAELSASDISDKQFQRQIINAYNKIIQKQGVAEGYNPENISKYAEELVAKKGRKEALKHALMMANLGRDPSWLTVIRYIESMKGVAEGAEFGSNYAEQLAQQTFDIKPDLRDENEVLNLGYSVAVRELGSRARGLFRDNDFPSDFVSAYGWLQDRKQGMAEGPKEVMGLANFAMGGGILGGQSPADIIDEQGVEETQQQCPECGGPMFPALILGEKQDACYYKVKSRYKVWPSAYASGALVQCRKKGAANWGNKK